MGLFGNAKTVIGSPAKTAIAIIKEILAEETIFANELLPVSKMNVLVVLAKELLLVNQ